MYTPFPVSMSFKLTKRLFVVIIQNGITHSVKKAVNEEVLNRDPESERKQDANPWCGLNTLVNIATQFSEPAESDPKD